MKEFKTISELQLYRKVCPICYRPLFFKGFTQFDNTILMKASYRSDNYIFNISTKTSRINYNIPDGNINTLHSGSNKIISLNPLILTSICPKQAKEDSFYSVNEYSLTFNIVHNSKQQGTIEKIQLASETFNFYEGKFYSVVLHHNLKKVLVEEIAYPNKVKRIFNMKYENINQDKIHNKNYILNKIQTILLLQ